ncbi:Uncharacterised protein [uncultured archaeon]|nr:Uncharacterised protein [uncultured archaeon]
MGALEQVTKMRNQGVPDSDIIRSLTQQKISPREINDAMKQAQIKDAVSDFDNEDLEQSEMPEEAPAPMEQEYETPEEQDYAPAPQEEYPPQESGYSAQEQIYPPQSSAYAEYSQGGTDTDTVIEIAEQIFSDKIRKPQNQIDAVSEAAAMLQSKLENVSERLKKIETIIDKLQIAILEKIGSYGQNLEGIKKEMSMMQDSFSKMVSPQKESKEFPRENKAQQEYASAPQEEYPAKKEFPREVKPQKKISAKR